ncbi:targeting protein for Xklp2-like isoform X2 [Hippoglossus hippoglossus]|uniref:targeting protein for Xklp2-like isoform X2 n=1 Tax=Hippoglossus hippoglossus TaxID=8267 RepID=UPI00148BD298|nr:targeting protein for Xklp2-like isoform X2 [Hippoglossus hippoglossus]XP_034447303.1 targeting protein for Xklp2-like isoform X2 [Hippoglossus hippoglossus]
MAESDCGSADRYEFDAPSHVVDLKELENNDGDDQWFEQQVGGAEGRLTTPLRPDWPFMRSNSPNLPKVIVIPQVNTDVDSGPGTSTSPPPNLVTSWGAETATRANGRPKRRTANQPPAQPSRISKRKVTTTGSAPTQSAATPSKKSKPSPVARPARKSSSVLRRSGQTNSRTAPKTGTVASKTGKTELCSSEEQELERIRNLQKEVALHRRQNEASYKAALAGNPPPKKVVLSMTVPKEFNFTTDNRIKATTSSSTADKEVDFISQLRKHSSPVKAMKGATIPKPFNLSRGNKRKVEGSGAYVPMAQQIEQYQKRTPDRYHLRSRQSQERGPHPVKGDQLKLTQPHTPHLMTRQRSRPTTVKSSAELEAEEVDQLHKFKFKALELNRKLLEGAEHLKKPAVKEPTVPEGFELQIEKRLQERQISKKSEEEERPHTFKSQPLPKRILEGVVGVPERKVLHPTVPESPAFALKKRVRVDRKVEEVKQPSPIKPPPVPHFGLPFQPRLPEHHHVEVCPFSFDERERERRAMKEKRLEEKRNEEVPQFKAQPLPDFESVLLPEKKKLEVTKPEPFRLLLDERGSVKNSRWEQMVKEEQKQQEEAATFKARPNTVTHKEPFLPKKPERAAAAVENFELSTERRARERQEYERLVSEKEALSELMEEEQRQEEEQQQKEEITRLRQEQVHKAQPVKHYKPVLVKKSDVPLTVPHTPKFSDRFRL